MGRQALQIKGITRDVNFSKFPADKAYNIENLRIINDKDTNTLSLVSEESTLLLGAANGSASITGVYIGHCILNEYFVLFTHSSTNNNDYIYRITIDDTTYNALQLYSGNLGFHLEPSRTQLETYVSYETEKVQKVYWIDGEHQPRVINIMADSDERLLWAHTPNPFDFIPNLTLAEEVNIQKINQYGSFAPGTIQYVLTYYNIHGQQSAPFYISPVFYIDSNGSGVSPEEKVNKCFKIQADNLDINFSNVRAYAILRSSESITTCVKVGDFSINTDNTSQRLIGTYENPTAVNNKACKFSNITAWKISSGKNVSLEHFLYNIDESSDVTTYNYRIPSDYMLNVNDSSLIGLSFFKANNGYLLISLPYNSDDCTIKCIYNDKQVSFYGYAPPQWGFILDAPNRNVTIIDNGIDNEVVDISEILYLNNNTIIPKTISEKSNTLFFGNYKYESEVFDDTFLQTVQEGASVTFGYAKNKVDKGHIFGYYIYKGELTDNEGIISSFKGGEVYTFGLVLQNNKGQWSSVIPLGSYTNPLYPKDGVTDYFYPVKAFISLNDAAITAISTHDFVKYKAVILNSTAKKVLCQGVISPTVFSTKRKDNLPYTQSSWFFRAMNTGNLYTDVESPACTHNYNIPSPIANYFLKDGIYANSGEIQGATADWISACGSAWDYNNMDMFVDFNTITLNSPEIDNDYVVRSDLDGQLDLRIVGVIPLTGSSSNIRITNYTPYNIQLRSYGEDSADHNKYDKVYRSVTVSGGDKVLTSCFWKDAPNRLGPSHIFRYYPVYPWHRTGALTTTQEDILEGGSEAETIQYGALDTKVYANMRISAFTEYLYDEGITYDNVNTALYLEDGMPAILNPNSKDLNWSDNKVCTSEIDEIITANVSYKLAKLDSAGTVSYEANNVTDPVQMRYKSTKHAIVDLSWKNNNERLLPYVIYDDTHTYGMYYAQSTLPFWNVRDIESTTDFGKVIAVLEKYPNEDTEITYARTQESNPYDSGLVLYRDNLGVTYGMISATFLENYYHGDAVVGDGLIFPNWKDPNINNESIVWVVCSVLQNQDHAITGYLVCSASETPSLCSFPKKYVWRYLSPSDTVTYYNLTATPPTVDADLYIHDTYTTAYLIESIAQSSINISERDSNGFQVLYLADLFYPDITIPINYNSEWREAGPPADLGYLVSCLYGDTFYQRYDCLKTYPYSSEDKNQIVEILSFMCETRINMDGRYDNMRGLTDNSSVTNTNFNVINKAYTQKSSIFNYNYLNPKIFNVNNFPNQIIWSKTKYAGEEVDSWCSFLPASVLDISGSKGKITKLVNWNDFLLCFQEKAINRIEYNERIAVSTSDGIPIEISNSNKVTGYKYISTELGSNNIKAIIPTVGGVCFVDSSSKDVFLYNGEMKNLSKEAGMSSYFNERNTEAPDFHISYDKNLANLYFIDSDKCLCYDMFLNSFISFFSYQGGYIDNIEDYTIGIKPSYNSANDTTSLFLLNSNPTSYGQYFDISGTYDITVVPCSTEDKIYSHMEYIFDSFSYANNTFTLDPADTFNVIRAEDEYQDSREVTLSLSNTQRKFRIWRTQIPRVYKSLQRMRNPWLKVTLSKRTNTSNKCVLYNINTYSV